MSLTAKLLTIFSLFFYQTTQPFTLMIDPIGDSSYTGREIEGCFERQLTLLFAQHLQARLEAIYPHLEVIITRQAGQTAQPYAYSSFANRLNVDLYLAISFYPQDRLPLGIDIFYYLEQESDKQHNPNPLLIYHAHQAHLTSTGQTQKIAQIFLECFKHNHASRFVATSSYGLPCLPLLAVQTPALYLEAGLQHKNDWKYLINPLLDCVAKIIL